VLEKGEDRRQEAEHKRKSKNSYHESTKIEKHERKNREKIGIIEGWKNCQF
jgi:hypothetical protein